MTHNWKVLHISETDSTNRYVRQMDSGDGDVVVWTDYQTAGRGCGTNTWESERGQNLLFSMLLHPRQVTASHQFLLLEAMSLAVKGILEFCVSTGTLSVKWPNDIYWNDSKLGGTLTECGLSGQSLKWCIIGTGINVNQETFRSDAPNPVSLAQITGHRYDVQSLLERILSLFSKYLQAIESGHYDELHAEYLGALYRRKGYHAFRDAHGEFQARITTVQPDGTLVLQHILGATRRYQFKEVQFTL